MVALPCAMFDGEDGNFNVAGIATVIAVKEARLDFPDIRLLNLFAAQGAVSVVCREAAINENEPHQHLPQHSGGMVSK
jgi:hypothetical protein